MMVVSRWAHTGNQIVATTPHMAGEGWKGKVSPVCHPTLGTQSTPEGREGSAGQVTERKPIPSLKSRRGAQERQYQGLVQDISRQEAAWEPHRERDEDRAGTPFRNQQTKKKKKPAARHKLIYVLQGKQICSLEISLKRKNESHP